MAIKVDVIVTAGALPAIAARRATDRLPIVFIGAADPVTSGTAASLARPGGNVTGLSLLLPELVGKRLELFKHAIPSIRRVAVLWQPGGFDARTEQDLLKGAAMAARALGLELRFFEARSPADIGRAFSERQMRVSTLSRPCRRRCSAASSDVSSPWRPGTGFPRCSSSGVRRWRRTDVLWTRSFRPVPACRRLRRQDPQRRAACDLPVEQPTKFELVVNLKTAQELGLSLSIRCRARGRADPVTQRNQQDEDALDRAVCLSRRIKAVPS